MSISRRQIQQRQRDIRETESAHFIADLIGPAQRVLNVGPSWGRDFYALQARGKAIVNLDIAPQRHLPAMVVADVTQGLPFSDGVFDAVLMAEVLEHLIEDWLALAEAQRVLKADGRLVISVPFYHDDPAYHVRVHSPRSITRLLAATGFAVEQVVYRGGWIRVPRFVHAVRKVLAPLGLHPAWYGFVLAMDRWWGQQPWAHRLAHGVYLAACKSETLDWRHLNRETFQH